MQRYRLVPEIPEKGVASSIDMGKITAGLEPQLRKKATELLKRIGDRLQLTPSDEVVYDDGSLGSGIIPLLEYFLDRESNPMPYDFHKFLELIPAAQERQSVIGRRENGKGWLKLQQQ